MTFKGKLIAGLAPASAGLCLVAAFSYQSLAQNAEDRRWVAHTYIVIEKLDDFQASLIDTETSQRGYIISGDEGYLRSFEKNRDAGNEQIRAVRQLTADNPDQQRALDHLEPLIQARAGLMESTVATRGQAGLIAGAEPVRAGPGKQLLEHI